MARRIRFVGALLLAAIAPPAVGLAFVPAAISADDVATFEALRAGDLRVGTVAYRLMDANRDLCRDHSPLTGLLVHDALQYGRELRAQAAAYFHLTEGPGVMAVVPGSPAEAAGLRPGDTLLALNRQPFARPSAENLRAGKAAFDEGAQIIERLEQELARGPGELEILRGRERLVLQLAAPAGCASRVQLIPESEYNSWADGRYVQITTAMAGFAQEDADLAVVIAHELAHNILRHRARLEAQGVPDGFLRGFGRNAARVRATEEEADYLSVYLIARAGYDPDAAARFWQRFGNEHGAGIFAMKTHPGWRTRTEALRRTAAEVNARRAAGAPLAPALPQLASH